MKLINTDISVELFFHQPYLSSRFMHHRRAITSFMNAGLKEGL